MSNISIEHKEKLQQLVYSRDFETVIQGLELLDTLIEEAQDIYDVFDLDKEAVRTVTDLADALRGSKYKYFVKVWILGRLAEMGEHWRHSVEDLDLEWTKTPFIPESIGYLTGLLRLDLQYLELGSLPLSIDKFWHIYF